jgi:hypothetical protein
MMHDGSSVCPEKYAVSVGSGYVSVRTHLYLYVLNGKP